MGSSGLDDHAALMGDWVPSMPSPRTFLSTMWDAEMDEKPFPNPPGENGKEGLEQLVSGNQLDQTSSEQKQNSRGGLLERMAARAGFDAPRLDTESIKTSDHSLNPDVKSPYLTIPPGLSPTSLLESPVFLSNSLAQSSPTTGKFPFFPNFNTGSSMSTSEPRDKHKDNFFDDVNGSSFEFKPVPEGGSSFLLGATSKENFPQQCFPSIEASVHSDSIQSPSIDPINVHSQNNIGAKLHSDFSRSSNEDDVGTDASPLGPGMFSNDGGTAEHSPLIDVDQDEEEDQRGGDSMAANGVGGSPVEDGFNWRKYGQKHVKGSEYPRSYYKCTHPNCLVKKKVERSYEGHITEIIYKGAHNHPKPTLNRRSSNPINEVQPDIPEQTRQQDGVGDMTWANAQTGTALEYSSDCRHDNLEVTSSASMGPGCSNPSASLQVQNGARFESTDAVDASSTFSNDEEEDDQGTHGSILGCDGEGDETDSKRRKIEAFAAEMSGPSRAIREPRVVVQTTSEVDILDDGYRWRKYGQKVVKGNPNPRSYYKCTSQGCNVRKHVERASHDLKSVITTYEGKHNHDVPAARNSSHLNSGVTSTMASTQQSIAAGGGGAANAMVQSQAHLPEQSQVHNSLAARFERPSLLNSFSFPTPGRQQLVPGPSPGFPFGMTQPGLVNLAMAGIGTSQGGKLPLLPVHPYLGQQQCQVNDMSFMLPKVEPKVESPSDLGVNMPSGVPVYQQTMSKLPLGPQM